MRIPYIFEFKNSALLGFFSSLRELSIKRGLAPEIKNETLEHIEDILFAIKLTAGSLDSDIAVRIEAVFSALNLLSEAEQERLAALFGVDRRNIRGYLIRLGQSDFKSVVKGVKSINPDAWRFEEVASSARKDKEEIMEYLKLLENNLYEIEMIAHREIKMHMKKSKNELIKAESTKETIKRIHNVRAEAKALMKRYYPYYRGRRTIESQLAWLEEYEKAIISQ